MPRSPRPYDRVRVVTTRCTEVGAPLGSLGYVIERDADGGLEVEVSADGTTIAQFVAANSDLEVAPEASSPG